jgi:hypothetical protein
MVAVWFLLEPGTGRLLAGTVLGLGTALAMGVLQFGTDNLRQASRLMRRGRTAVAPTTEQAE